MRTTLWHYKMIILCVGSPTDGKTIRGFDSMGVYSSTTWFLKPSILCCRLYGKREWYADGCDRGPLYRGHRQTGCSLLRSKIARLRQQYFDAPCSNKASIGPDKRLLRRSRQSLSGGWARQRTTKLWRKTKEFVKEVRRRPEVSFLT